MWEKKDKMSQGINNKMEEHLPTISKGLVSPMYKISFLLKYDYLHRKTAKKLTKEKIV